MDDLLIVERSNRGRRQRNQSRAFPLGANLSMVLGCVFGFAFASGPVGLVIGIAVGLALGGILGSFVARTPRRERPRSSYRYEGLPVRGDAPVRSPRDPLS